MMAKTALMVNDLFALSDALAMPLELFDTGKIEGQLKRAVVIPDISLRMNMEVKVIRSKVEWAKKRGAVEPKVAMLVHVIGDLFLMMAYDGTSGELICMVIDAAKIKRFQGETTWQGCTLFWDDNKKLSVANLMKAYLPFSVAEFLRGQYDTEWQEAA
jgi:hypothetical protein